MQAGRLFLGSKKPLTMPVNLPDDVLIGEMRMFGGNFAPAGFFLCEGQLLPISEYSTLYQLIGTTYGGDGQTNFALPDLRGRVPVHISPVYVLGFMGGEETVSLLPNNLPVHTHTLAASDTGGGDDPKGNAWGAATGTNVYAPPEQIPIQMSNLGISTEGKGKPHDNLSPYLCVSFIIAYVGQYPSPPAEEEQP
jgi:microcystin-dependent protein